MRVELDEGALLVRSRVAGDIYERSPFHRRRLDRSGLGRRGIHGLLDLTRLPPMTLDDVPAPSSLLLAQDKERASSSRRYSPLEWIQAGAVPLSYSDDDLLTLGDLGETLLRSAGVRSSDLIANLIPAGPTREHLQLTLGAQTLGVSSIDLGANQPIEAIALLEPTVLVGDAKELARVLDSASLDEQALGRVHTVVLVGEASTPRQHREMTERLGGNKNAIVRAWAPTGVLALWGQCRGGTGFHTSPTTELVEVVDPVSGMPVPVGRPGNAIWTGVGWYSSAVLRLDTQTAVVARTGTCSACGRKSMRLEPMEHSAGFPEVLDASIHVNSWYAELQRNDGRDELVIWANPASGSGLLELLTELNLKIGPVEVRLADAEDIERRIGDANGERFGDHRAFQ